MDLGLIIYCNFVSIICDKLVKFILWETWYTLDEKYVTEKYMIKLLGIIKSTKVLITNTLLDVGRLTFKFLYYKNIIKSFINFIG